MASSTARSVALALLVLLCALLAACNSEHLRGSVTPSADGGTYLVFIDDNGGGCGPIIVNGQEWPYPIGTAGPVKPGRVTVECGGQLSFEVPEGVLFSFDYWEP